LTQLGDLYFYALSVLLSANRDPPGQPMRVALASISAYATGANLRGPDLISAWLVESMPIQAFLLDFAEDPVGLARRKTALVRRHDSVSLMPSVSLSLHSFAGQRLGVSSLSAAVGL